MNDEKLPIPSWDEWFMRMAYHVATKSKDKSSRIGSVIVKDNQVVKIGYNGFPRDVNDNVEERQNRPLKYSYVAHSEANAIFFAARDGAKTEGCFLYTNGVPCVECAKAIIQSGISKVIYHSEYDVKWNEFAREKWSGHNEITTTMFNESNVELIPYEGILGVKALIAGNIIEL